MPKKPHQQNDSQDQQTAAPKKPGSANKVSNNDKREARLAEALRANLRRRKSREQGPVGQDQIAPEQGERES